MCFDDVGSDTVEDDDPDNNDKHTDNVLCIHQLTDLPFFISVQYLTICLFRSFCVLKSIFCIQCMILYVICAVNKHTIQFMQCVMSSDPSSEVSSYWLGVFDHVTISY